MTHASCFLIVLSLKERTSHQYPHCRLILVTEPSLLNFLTSLDTYGGNRQNAPRTANVACHLQIQLLGPIFTIINEVPVQSPKMLPCLLPSSFRYACCHRQENFQNQVQTLSSFTTNE